VIVRLIYCSALVLSIGVLSSAHPSAVHAASITSSADRARIAMLVYQSQSARQADLRRGDAATRELRAKAAAADKMVVATRTQLATARARGASAEKRALLLERELDEHEQALAKAAETYTNELAKRDEDYARERAILLSTGERLLKTPEGRKVLDLYNSGGEANWKEAKTVLEVAQRARRALDARDTARLYGEARAKGLETARAALAKYEEVVRDDSGQVDDWLAIAFLRRDLDEHAQSLVALDRAESVATTARERWGIALHRSYAASATKGEGTAIPFADQAVALMREILKGKHIPTDHGRLVESLKLSADLHLNAAIMGGDRGEYQKAREAAADAEIQAANPRHRFEAPELLVESRLVLGEVFRLHERDFVAANRQYDSAIAQARSNVAARPQSLVEKRRLAGALRRKAAAWLNESRVDGVDLYLREAIEISRTALRSDAESMFSAVNLANDYSELGRILKMQRRFDEAKSELMRGLEISRRTTKNGSLSAHNVQRFLRMELGHVQLLQNRFDEAVASYTSVLRSTEEQIARSRAGNSSASASAYERDRVMIYAALAQAYHQNGRRDTALKWSTKAIEALDADQSTLKTEAALMSLSEALMRRAQLFSEEGQEARALRDFERARGLLADHLRDGPAGWRAARLHAGFQSDWGATLAQRGRASEAIAYYTAAKAEFEKLREAHPEVVDIQTGYAMALFRLAEQNAGVTWQAVADLVDDLDKRHLLAPMECRCLEKARDFARAEK